MECLVHRVPMRDPGDASAILRLIDEGLISPREIVAVLGKTEAGRVACCAEYCGIALGCRIGVFGYCIAPRIR
jgi:Amidohydrolase ring-opening protein (Amido_AtzD_TrzD)